MTINQQSAISNQQSAISDWHMATSAIVGDARLAADGIRVDHRAQEDWMIKAIKFASVPVRDQDRALEFYTKKLGFRVITDSPFNETQRWIELGLPRADTKLVLFTGPGQEQMIGGFMNVTFTADDVEATAKEMKANGVEFVQDPQKADWGTAAIFKDADGNRFVLSTP
jgi:catechol 2,3-dioxygenase-like lactoylglutathione lyase family enzyme